MARGIFTLSKVRAKKFRDEWDKFSDVWLYQGNPVNRSAYGFRTPTVDGPNWYPAASFHEKISWDTDTATPLPGLTPADNRWVMANSRDAYHCAAGSNWPSQAGGDIAPINVNKIAFSNDSQSAIPALIDYAEYNRVTQEVVEIKDRGLEQTVSADEGASTIGNNDAGYIIGGKKYDSISESTFHPSGFFVYTNDYGYASSQYHKINYSSDVKSILPGSNTGESYRGNYLLSFGNLDKGYVGGGYVAGTSSPQLPSTLPSIQYYTGYGPWQNHSNSTMFRLTYSTETSARVPSLTLGTNLNGSAPGGRYASFSNGADGNNSVAYTMGMASSDYSYGPSSHANVNARSNIEKITFSTETMSNVSGANRTAIQPEGRAGFDVRSASSGTSVYAGSTNPSVTPSRVYDKFQISDETMTTLPSTGLNTNMFASANGQGKPYQGSYQIPLDLGPAVNGYGQPGIPPAPTPTPLQDPQVSVTPRVYGYILRNGMELYKVDRLINSRDQNNLINPRFDNIGIYLGKSWMKQGNLTAGPDNSNGWYRWFDNIANAATLDERRELTLPVHGSAALTNREYGYITGGDEYVDTNSPVSSSGLRRSYSLFRSDTHKINYANDSVNHLPSSNLSRERAGMQSGGNTTKGYVLGGSVLGTEASGNPIYIVGDKPRNTDCEKITYSTETYSSIPANVPDFDTTYGTRRSGHTIGTMDYLYYNAGPAGGGFQKFTFSTDGFSALPGVPTLTNDLFYRTSDGDKAFLYGHSGDTNIGRITFSTDTIDESYMYMPSYSDAFGETYGYSFFDGSRFVWCNKDGKMYHQSSSTGTVFYSSAPETRLGFSLSTPANSLIFDGACNNNNGMGGPEPRNLNYTEETLL